MAKHTSNEIAGRIVPEAVKLQRKRAVNQPQTKRDQLIHMLSARSGAGADVICRKFGW